MMWKLALSLAVMMLGLGCLTAPYKDAAGTQVRYAGKFDTRPVEVPTKYTPKSTEWRGVWVATVENIDFPKVQSADAFKKEFQQILANLQSINANVLVFQVRPTNDAFYPSHLNPWSRFLTGTEGQKLGTFDPLRYMVEEAHKRGIEFHAWLNPYRVVGATKLSKEAYLATLAPNNFARQHPELVMAVPTGDQRMLIFNPGEPQVIRFILATATEIAYNYNVDGIHFDDYFYPYSGMSDALDQKAFEKYNPRKLTRANWRRSNVNQVISGIHDSLAQINQQQKRNVKFGISPFGIWANKNSIPTGSLTGGKQAYSELYADVLTWIKSGWIDYVVPQVYWHFNHDVAAYAAVTDWWAGAVKNSRTNLYIGHSVGRLGSTQDRNEFAAQLRYNNTVPEVKGECLFSYRSIFRPTSETMRAGGINILKQYWQRRAALPR